MELRINRVRINRSRPVYQGCARFPEFLENVSERQILWSLCLVVFLGFTLRLPIQTSLPVVPELQVSVSSLENCPNFSKTSHPWKFRAITELFTKSPASWFQAILWFDWHYS